MKIFNFLIPFFISIQLAWGSTYEEVLSQHKYSVVRITDKNYNNLIKNDDYHLIIYLTASNPQIGCVLCKDFQPIYETIASSYYDNLKKQDEPSDTKLIIAISDFIDSRRYFQELALNNVPKIFHYPPGTARALTPSSEFQFVNSDSMRQLVSWILSNVDVSPSLFHIVEKKDYTSLAITVSVCIGVMTLAYRNWKRVGEVFTNKRGWQGFAMVLVVLFTSGYMFNIIRNTQYIKINQDGSKDYFIGGHQAQLGVETQILCVVYGSFTLLMVLLVDKVSTIKDQKIKTLATLSLTVAIFVLYSYLISCFQAKNTGYPYWLLKI